MRPLLCFLLVLSANLPGCGPSAAQGLRPAPAPTALREMMRGTQAAAHAYSADARLTYFGPDGRLKGTASLLVQRPDKLRYELQGPHGGVLLAVVSDGSTLTALDFKENRLVRGPATAANFDRLLSVAPLNLDSVGWVDLLFGDVSVPADAKLDGKAWRWQWARPPQSFTVTIDPETSRPTAAEVRHGEALVSSVKVLSRDGRGLPEALHLQVPAAKVEVEVRLREVTYDPEVSADVFSLAIPRGASEERLP